MIARETIETMQRRSESWREPLTISPAALSELCHVYLAWMDAPTSIMIRTFTYDNDFLAAQSLSVDDEERLSGKTVRLVEVK